MAQVVIEKSPLAAFMEELPGLVMQYQQLQFAQEERALEREERKAATAQQIVLKEYYDKKDEVQKFEAMYDKYDNLKPSDMTSGAADIISIVDEHNNINMNAITKNLNTLSNYKNELTSGLDRLKGQAQTLKEMQADFAGVNRVLDPHEYEAFQEHALKALEEGGLGWETTAGADVEYYKVDPTTRYTQALRITEKMKSDEDAGAKGNYAILQGMYTLGENEDADDLVERLSTDNYKPSEEVIAAIQRMAMQPSYGDFIDNLNAYPAEAGGDLIRAELMANPNTSMIYNNLQQNYKAISALDAELGGINETNQESNYDAFIDQISGVTNKEAVFGVYDSFTQGLDPAEHSQYFDALELASGMGDLGPAYLEYKGMAGGINNNIDQSLNRLEQETMTGEELFPGLLESQYRGMEYEMAYSYPELAEGISKDEHVRNQMQAIIGSQVGVDAEIFGDEAEVVDTKLDKDGRIMLKVDPGLGHPPRWNADGKPIYLDKVNITSLGRAQEAMPTAFAAGPIGYYWDPIREEYVIKRNQ